MDVQRHKTLKKQNIEFNDETEPNSTFKSLLEDSAREAYSRPWHRIERGLRLNRLRIFIEDIASQYEMTLDEKEAFFLFLQKIEKSLGILNFLQIFF